MLADSAGNMGIVWTRWKLGQTNVKWGDRRRKCEEASQWLKGAGHSHARGKKEVSQI
jgi:hypothetical protein